MSKRYYGKSEPRDPDFAIDIATELSAASLATLKKYEAKLEEASVLELDAKKILSDWFSAQMRTKGLIAENELVSGFIRDKDGKLCLFKRAVTRENKRVLETAKPAVKAKALI